MARGSSSSDRRSAPAPHRSRGAGREAGRGGAGLTARADRPAPRLPLARLPGGPEEREAFGTSPGRRFSAASAPYALGTRAHCLQTGPFVITTLHRDLPSTHRSEHSFAFQNFRPAATGAHLRGSQSGFSHPSATVEANEPVSVLGNGALNRDVVHCVHWDIEANRDRADSGNQGRNLRMSTQRIIIYRTSPFLLVQPGISVMKSSYPADGSQNL